MRWPTHVMGGIASLWIVVPLATAVGTPADNLGLLTVCAAFGALLPDLDANDSRLQHIEPIRGITPFAPLGKILSEWLGHRGPMHSLIGLAVVSAIVGVPLSLAMGWLYGLALVLGYASHLLLDAMTVTGIPLLYPSKYRFWLISWRALRIVTGSPEEEGIFAVLSLVAITLLLRQMMTTLLSVAG